MTFLLQLSQVIFGKLEQKGLNRRSLNRGRNFHAIHEIPGNIPKHPGSRL
mgnify:CR=1 FL=1